MAPRNTIAVICSDQPRNGKTLLARVLADFLLYDGRDPFLIDTSFPEGTLRSYFPGRTALVDIGQVTGQMKAIDTIMQFPGRDYVIDVAAPALPHFCEAVKALDLPQAFRAADLTTVVLFIVDQQPESIKAAADTKAILQADAFVAVRNREIGSALPTAFAGLTLEMPRLDPAVRDIVENRRVSLRAFLQGDETAIPVRLRPALKSFLATLRAEFGDLADGLNVESLRVGSGVPRAQ